MLLDDLFKEQEREGFIKQIADKLYQGIQDAYDTPESNKRRWVWELIQNAKDVPNSFGPVIINISLTTETLTFEHNGNPFTIKSLIGLLQQVSSKPSQSIDAEITGKFGTGFITTHMLSKIINVHGILDYGIACKKFKIDLDRSAEDAEQLAAKVKDLLITKDLLSDDSLYPPIDKKDLNRTAANFDTKFIYPLSTITYKYARQGIDDLIESGPYTLLLNSGIDYFVINDKINNKVITIKKTLEKVISGTNIFQTADSYIAFKNKENSSVIIAIPVKISAGNEINEILPLSINTPVLFKDFPLVGTEEWMFSFICDAKNFQPTERRDNLRLHIEPGQDGAQAEINRGLLKETSTLAIQFINELSEITEVPDGIHLLAQSGLPLKEHQEDVLVFLREIQLSYRDEIKKLKIVLTCSGYKKMNECRFPFLESTHVADNNSSRLFYRLCFFPFGDVLPVEKHFEDWEKIIRPQNETWGQELLLTVKDLLVITQSWDSINGLVSAEKDSTQTVFDWLNDLYKFIDENKLVDVYRHYRLIPNQKGKLINVIDAIRDADRKIPEILKDTAEVFGKKYRDNLADERIICKELQSILNIEKIANELNPEIGKLQKPELIKAEQLNAIYKLCNIFPDQLSTEDKRREGLVKHLGLIIGEWTNLPLIIPSMKSFNFEPSLRVAVRHILYYISTLGTIAELKTKLVGFTDDDLVVDWLDKLVQLIREYTEFSTYLDSSGVFPNQLGKLCLKKNLSSDVDEIDPYIKNIHEQLRPDLKLREKLLHNRFKHDLIDSKILFPQVAAEIDLEIRRKESELDDHKTRDAALNMISWLSKKDNSDRVQYFSWIDSNKSSIVLKTLNNDQEHIFKILQSNQDFQKLAEIANNQNFAALSELASSGYDIEKLKQIYQIAGEAGGIEKLQEYIAGFAEENEDFTFRTYLGTHVENLFKGIFSHLNATFTVERVPHGQDFILKIGTEWEYRVEIKSFAVGKERVHMSMKQGETAVKHHENYALCVLERPTPLELVTIDYFKANAYFISDIGERLKNRVEAAQNIKDILSQNDSEEGGIDFDSTNYKYRIGKKVWKNPPTFGYIDFVKFVEGLINIHNLQSANKAINI